MRKVMEMQGPLDLTIHNLHSEKEAPQQSPNSVKRGQTALLVEKRRDQVRSRGRNKLKWLLPALILSTIMGAASICVGLFIEPLPTCHLPWPMIFKISGMANLIVTIATTVLMASLMSLALNQSMLKETVYHEQGRDNEFIAAVDQDPSSTLANCRAALGVYVSGGILLAGAITLIVSSICAITTGIMGNACGKMASMYLVVFFANVAANVFSQGLV